MRDNVLVTLASPALWISYTHTFVWGNARADGEVGHVEALLSWAERLSKVKIRDNGIVHL